MKVKIIALVEAQDALSALAKKDLSITNSYKVVKLLKAAQQEIEIFEESRIKLLKSLGSTLDKENNSYTIPADKREEFGRKYAELADIEVEIPDKISLTGENISITPAQLIMLEPFIELE